MPTINDEPNSNTKPDSCTPGETDLHRIINAGRFLTIDELVKLRKVLGKFCSRRVKKIIREKLAAPTIQWGNPSAYKQMLFLDTGEIKFIASKSHRKELAVCRGELLGPL